MSNLNYWFRKYWPGIAALAIFLACVPHCWPQGTGTSRQMEILGFSPSEADIGQSVQMRVSSKLSSNNYLVHVNRTIVKTTIDSENPLWIKFDIPGSLPPVDSVEVTLMDGDSTTTATLKINPIQIMKVDPVSAKPGEGITLTIHPTGVALRSDAKLIFAPSDSETAQYNFPSSPVQIMSAGEVRAVVPTRVPVGPVSLTLVANGHSSAPYNRFTINEPVSVYLRWIQVAAIALAIILVYFAGRFSGRLFKRFRGTAPKPSPTGPESSFEVPALEIPSDLVDACLRGQCVLYSGAGLSARSGLPTWRTFVEGLLKWAESAGMIDPSFARSLEQALQSHGGHDRVADSVVSAVLDRGANKDLEQYLNQTFEKNRSLSDVHRLLPDLKPAAALTTNFDGLLEQAFGGRNRNVTVYIPSDIDQLQSAFSARRFFVLKLYGTLQRPESLLISPAQYLERIRADRPFSDFVQQVFHSRTLLFLGASFAGIEAYLAPLKISRGNQIRRYAVVAVSDAGWRADADALERRYGIRVLPYVASALHSELFHFVNELREKIKNANTGSGHEDAPYDEEQAAVVLTGVQLQNIGPFERLELSFTRRWTVLLGDNGVGKSSVLRAIAAAVAGDKAGAAGARLLRSGQTEGRIQVTTKSGERYTCQVFLDSLKRPDIASEGASGLGGSILVLAFPAIRTMASGSVRGPELRDLQQPPTASDVLPSLQAMPDPRILGFKQWLVNLDYSKTKGPELAARVSRMLETLTSAIGILFGGMKLDRIQVADNDVFVETDDGRLSLDSLSQGTISILGWVGVLVQRLHEVSDKPDGHALVLLDEIDAHMHPEWQQAIIARLVKAFPLVQFIVSTHSPFLAVGRQAQEIIRFRRDAFSKKVIAEVADRDTTDMTVADVLTSYLFGLQTAVDHGLQQDILRLRELSVTEKLSTQQLDELKDLETKLDTVGIATTQADPLYGQFVEELKKQRTAGIAKLPPLSKKAQERQRELTREAVRQVLANPGASGKQEAK
ncbi:MAG: AAA family ATPase [Terriglobales bacterium]